MRNAGELLDVITASPLLVTEKLAEQREEVTALLDHRLNHQPPDKPDGMATDLAELLIGHGIVLSDLDSVAAVISEYLQIMEEEQSTLGDEERDFLESFLK